MQTNGTSLLPSNQLTECQESETTINCVFNVVVQKKIVFLQRLYNVLRFMDSIGKAIEKRRKELGVTQEQLSELCDVSINTLISVERSQGNPTLRVVNEILSVLGMHLEVKINDNEEAESIQQ